MRNAIVTGAGRNLGIGAEICRAFAQSGINVYFTTNAEYDTRIAGISQTDYEKTRLECAAYDVAAFFHEYDLCKQQEILHLFDDAERSLGHIDILVNCLCYHTHDGIDNLTEELLDSNFAVNAKSIMLLCKEFYNRFTGEDGRIICLSSTQNLEPLTTEIAYAISKASVPVVISTLAPIMAKKGVRINAVNPGATEIGDIKDRTIDDYKSTNKFGRLGMPSDAANIVTFLVSEKGQWITGQIINSEGGTFRGLI
jgi:3-oxoacyl-[acyl-carrier protein] reductase